ncbi:single-stranded-DNA-specific exonuclease RecJ [Patulibacter defluvii]|uniref:single-stranded-DNA-specific exonuclease RecJ n=1 Tax=Patulibacter defluvii TaxID=3095358 RepID=UPI002A762F25|nr:single-stranded-DNA-specific exonuclease RecJ [Patulibacter sp. DM4]
MDVRFEIPPASEAAVAALRRELGVGDVTAQVLVRRGLADPDDARRFLAADEGHPLEAFAGLADAAEVVVGHVRAGSRIVVHGDYDCDGVCATATLVRALRQIGADASWFLPHRIDDGYGLAADTVRRLAAEGAGLVVTVDCGITAVDEAALARELGLDLVITDHHRPRADGRLPEVPLVHPGLPAEAADGTPGGAPPATRYPAPQLCGAGVAWRLAGAILAAAGEDPAGADIDLDVVALATIADVVPLTGENRTIVRRGLAAITDARRPGLRALLDVSATAPADVDSTAVGFRLAPRINAAGRIGRADTGVALLLCDDPVEARRLADQLDGFNRDRRELEARILREAEAQATEQGDVPVHVLAGEGWHPGVVGIVASRIAERFQRPAVLLSVDGEEASGSARSVPGFDLLAGLDACAEHLTRHGGHRAAAGCALATAAIPAFRAALSAYAAEHLDVFALVPVERVDAVVGGQQLGMALAEELGRLGPFGEGNPEPVLLVPAGWAESPRPLGAAGAHLAFTLRSGGSRVAAVAFGRDRLPAVEGPIAGSYALERHSFRGSTIPRLRVRELAAPTPAAIDRLDGDAADVALAVLDAVDPFPPADEGDPGAWRDGFDDRSQAGAAAAIAALVASGDAVTVVTADAARRVRQLAPVVGGFALTDWWSLTRAPRALDGTVHLVALDPPSDAVHLAAVEGLEGLSRWRAWGDPELRFTVDALRREHDLRSGATPLYRRLRDGGPTAVAALAGDELPGWWLGLLLRVLEESGAVVVDREERIAALAPGPVRPLEDGDTHRAWTARHEGRQRWLSGTTIPRPSPMR